MDGISKVSTQRESFTNMATVSGVAVWRKSTDPRRLNPAKYDESGPFSDGIECNGQAEMEKILSNCPDVNLRRVYEIDLHASKVTKMEDFEKFPKLRCLDLSCNQINAIRALDKNHELKELKLYANDIKKLEGLGNLTELCSLQLQENRISTVGMGLQNLKKLKVLRLDCNEISGISFAEIATCSKLTFLDISYNKLEDISFINTLPCLEEFYASHNKIVEIPDLGRCKRLLEIDLSHNQISSFGGIKSLSSVMIIRLNHNFIKDMGSANCLATLEELYLGGNKLSNIKKVSELFPSIEVLDMTSNLIDCFDTISNGLLKCLTLRELFITGNPCLRRETLAQQKLAKALPSLEVLNGTQIGRPQSSHRKNRLPMRPVSASQVLSTKQVEEQISSTAIQQNSFESMISSKFAVVYDSLKRLQALSGHEPMDETCPSPYRSACNNLVLNASSLDEASASSSTKNCCGRPSSKTDFQTFGQNPSSSPTNSFDSRCLPGKGIRDFQRSVDISRPSSRCSNRARIHDAMIYAEQHFKGV